jgi:RNA polymerase sigma-70 factor (ECF subfamily)
MEVGEPLHGAGPECTNDEILSLVCAAQSGDQEAFRALYERFCVRPVYTLALSLLNDHSLAEDTTQETFVKVYRELASFDPQRGTFTAWLITITRHVCVDAYRKRQSRLSLSHPLSSAHEALIVANTPDPLLHVLGLEEQERFRQAVAHLPPRLREVVDLVIVKGESYSVAATMLGCTTGAIGSYLYKARQRLQRYLEDNP